jgi:Carboxypeptidase regulatory-like domain
MLGKISACLMAILLSASCVIGQSTFGSIVGVVKDPAERTIADAQITLTNLDDHAQRNTSADSNGAFECVNLKPGHYESGCASGNPRKAWIRQGFRQKTGNEF